MAQAGAPRAVARAQPPASAAPRPACEAVSARRTVVLASETDLEGFRAAARRLLAGGVAPHDVEWRVADAAQGELSGDDGAGGAGRPAAAPAFPGGATVPGDAQPRGGPAAAQAPADCGPACGGDAALPVPAVRVPAAFVALCAEVVLHRDPGRFGLLYRLLWRLAHEPALRADPIDPDRIEAGRMARAVRRDVHRMKAFVRFRPVGTRPAQGVAAAPEGTAALHVAWFEPAHRVVEAVAPHFARRHPGLRWALLTPDRSARWDGTALCFGPGARRADAPPADAGEALWLTYYESIFNPARLKLAALRREMPTRYWPGLPEAVLIAPLAATAHERGVRMIERVPAAAPRRRIPARDADSGLAAAPRPAMRHTAAMAVATDTDPGAAAPDRAAALAALRDAAARCRECPLWQGATQTVFGEGPLDTALMLVGEQPGDQEDLRGRPFVGPAGRLLDRALAELGWPRERLYATNAVKHFKFELRGTRRIHKTPAQKEADACLHWLEDEIALVRPRAAVALGATAARQLLGRPVAVLRERGRWHERADGLRVLVTLHPSALLRTPPEARDEAVARWLDDLRVASALLGAAPAAD